MDNMIVNAIRKKTRIFYIFATVIAIIIGVYLAIKGITVFDRALESENNFLLEVGIILLLSSVFITAFNVYMISFLTDLLDGYSLLIENSCLQTDTLVEMKMFNQGNYVFTDNEDDCENKN